LDAEGARQGENRPKAIRIKSSHHDQFFQFQIIPLQSTLPDPCVFVASDCGDFVGIFRFLLLSLLLGQMLATMFVHSDGARPLKPD
jgi:hypothetical protein